MQRIIVLLFLFIVSAFAKESNYLLSASLVGMSMDYREYDKENILLDSEKSDLYEMFGSEFRVAYSEKEDIQNSFELGANLRMLSGNTEYVGSLIDSGLSYGSYIGETHNIIYDVSFDYIYRYDFENNFSISAGLGLGYRSWRRELSPSQVELYSWYSLRPKMALSHTLQRVQISLAVEYQYGLDTTMDILANGENGKKSLNLGFANIVTLTPSLHFSLNKDVDIFVSYLYEYQSIGASNRTDYVIFGTTYSVYEPKSTANNHYMKLGARIKF